jgi:hypothetical protein
MADTSRGKLTVLRQRNADQRAMYLPVSDELREARLEKQKVLARRSQLKLRRGEGGPELEEDDPQMIDVQREIDKLDAEITRLTTLEQDRGARMSAVGTLVRACEDYLRTRRGQLVEVPAIDVADVLRKGERLHDGIERLPMRLRELDADRHRIESAPYPSADVKQRMRDQIEALAMRSAPSVDRLIEHNPELGWPQTMVQLPLVAISGERGERIVGTAQGEVPDVLGLMAWLFRPQLIKACEALVDTESDDSSALSQRDRETRFRELARDALLNQRAEAAIIWHMQQAGDAVEHRSDIDPRAVLGVETR